MTPLRWNWSSWLTETRRPTRWLSIVPWPLRSPWAGRAGEGRSGSKGGEGQRGTKHPRAFGELQISDMTGGINAPAHSRHDIGYTGRFREDGRVIEGLRQIVRGVSSQHNERFAGRP